MFNNLKENRALERQVKELTAENNKLKELNTDIRFNEKQVAYVRHLIMQDEVLNDLDHGMEGLYTVINMPFLDFITDVRVKLQAMERQNGSKEDWYE
jgi:hypothetical protein